MKQDFWCRTCDIDVTLNTVTVWKNDLLKNVWLAHCPSCSNELLRYQGDLLSKDPYFRLSRKVALLRFKHQKDTLQPNDPWFDIIYPQHKREKEEKLLKKEKEAWEKRKTL